MNGVNHIWLETKLMKQNFTWLTRAKKFLLTKKFFSSISYFSTAHNNLGSRDGILLLLYLQERVNMATSQVQGGSIFKIKKVDLLNYYIFKMATGQVQRGSSRGFQVNVLTMGIEPDVT